MTPTVPMLRVGVRPALRQYIQEVWRLRTFIYVLAKFRFIMKFQTSRLGYFWLVFIPLIDAALYGTVFGVLQGSHRPDNFIQFLVIGVFLFRVYADCLSAGARSIVNNQALVQSLSFPRAVLPLASVLEQFLSFLPTLGIVLALSFFLGELPSLNWLWLIPLLVAYALFNAGVAFFMARMAIRLRDINQMIPFANRFMRYFSGVFYDPAAFVGSMSPIMLMFVLNPVYDYMELARYILISGYVLDKFVLVSALTWSFATFTLGGLFFWMAEARYGQID